MQYFFILGSNPTLSLAELAAVFNNLGKLSLIQTNIAILDTDQAITANLLEKIGGTIKFGLIHDEVRTGRDLSLLLMPKLPKPAADAGKFYFGFSAYGKTNINIKVLAMEFKKLLKQSGVNSRWVTSQEPTLSSVVVEQNKLTTGRGVEIVIIQFNKKLLLGKTLAVQPFKDLSFRDYGRPARDDRSGMLPPKLAQIMINLAAAAPLIKGVGGILKSNHDAIILDPFCGSGTIVTEAMLMGYEHVIGTDLSAKAIEDTKRNIEWTKDNYQLKITNYELKKSNATEISKYISPNSINAIITEPYLGPQRGEFSLEKIIKELEMLYSRSLSEFKKILKPAGRIVMIWPRFHNKRKNIFLNPDLAGLKIVNPVPAELQKNIFVKLTDRQTMVYGREQQKVWREIVILEK
ncbi:MAG: methyltransferase domain-containing protein [Patescibacteria group bacterium]|nr:methyltransferase domain-containing protein [Patescibacteria group bacterium]